MFSLLGIIPSLSGILSAVISLGTMIASKLIDFIGWYLKEFWKGLGVIFHNLSVLTVLLVVFIGGGYYFKTWDNDRVLKECIKTCPTPTVSSKYEHPLKKKVKSYTRQIPKPMQRPPMLRRDPFGEQ